MEEILSSNVDITDVARVAKVSPSTVSRAFNHPEKVKLPTRRRIERAVEKLGYIRNRAAQTMHGRRSGTIGLIVPTIAHSIFSEVTQAFSEAADQAGFSILMATHGYDLPREVQLLRKFLEHRVDGVALIGLEHEDAVFTLIERQSLPTVAMWSYDAAARVPCFGADNVEAGRIAAQHLITLGHRKIGLVFPPVGDNERAAGRLAGALEVLHAAAITPSDAWRIEAVYSVAVAKREIGSLFGNVEQPTALLCGNDIIAQGALFAAAKAGVSVPQDLSIVGIGDFTGSADLEPGLTTVRIPAREIGLRAVDHLVAQIAAADATDIVREKFEVELCSRGTVRRV